MCKNLVEKGSLDKILLGRHGSWRVSERGDDGILTLEYLQKLLLAPVINRADQDVRYVHGVGRTFACECLDLEAGIA